MRRTSVLMSIVVAAAGLGLLAGPASAYPLDGYEATGIVRLQGYWELRPKLLARGSLQAGSMLGRDEVRLRLRDRPEFALPSEPDPVLSKRLTARLGDHADRYGIAVLDLSDLESPRYLAHRPHQTQNPGSVGKIVVGLALFQALADQYPENPARRAEILRETEVVADGFIRSDSHEVPFWQPGQERILKRPLREGDRGNLYSYLDWMLSSSSNAAASMVQKQLVLLRHFGVDYPVAAETADAYLRDTPSRVLGQALSEAMLEPLARNGLDARSLRQGGFFTQEGKRRMPAGDSTSTPAELLRFLLYMEQGRLVDAWSSLELKRLLYLTDRRIRYASHPALAGSAVYFKSGSLYSCRAEEGFACGKYKGNLRNFMNSIAIVETREPGRELHYLVAVLSNVLRENSAVAHQTLALRIHRLIESLHPVDLLSKDAPVSTPGPEAEELSSPSESAPRPAIEIQSEVSSDRGGEPTPLRPVDGARSTR